MRHIVWIVMRCFPPLPNSLTALLLAVACTSGTTSAAEPVHAARLQRLATLAAPPSRHDGGSATITGDTGANACLTLLASDPAAALDYAQDWSKRAGGDEAARCAALADVALGDPASGAAALDALSRHDSVPAADRALLADQAAQSWLLASQPDRALASALTAAALDPGNPDLLVDQARAAVAAGRPASAVEGLSQVLKASPRRGDALLVRATAYLALNRIPLAKADIEAACALLPDAPDALLERGILRQRLGDLDGARTDWTRILSLSPDTQEADLAQQDLALLDAGPDAR